MKGKVAPLIKEYYPQYYSIETYPANQCAPFCKVKDEWGIFSNFGKTPIVVDGVTFNCAEQLFQCLKFTSDDAIADIYGSSGQTIKMKAKKWSNTEAIRSDWGAMIVDAMKYCLRLKHGQSEAFRAELERSKGLYIVEDQTTFSKKQPDTWGVKLQDNNYVGPNLMGRLLMELRDNPEFDYKLPSNIVAQLIESINKIGSAKSTDIITLTRQDARFPKRLLDIGEDCPNVIYCLGNTELLNESDAVAVIGARAADKEGLDAAYRVAYNYAKNGAIIISGLAKGCDTAAHRAAIDAGGKTIAVVASGLDSVYPAVNKKLQEEILSHGGLIISEQPLGIQASPTRLIARNRIQAALSESVILAQCPAHSGSLHTMSFGLKYHKKCYAVKFSKWYAENSGNKNLIDTGNANQLVI